MKSWNPLLLLLLSLFLVACGNNARRVATPLQSSSKEVQQKQKQTEAPKLVWENKRSEKTAIQQEDQSHKQRILRAEQRRVQLLKELRRRQEQRQEQHKELSNLPKLKAARTPASVASKKTPRAIPPVVTSVSKPLPPSKTQVTQDRRKLLQQALASLKLSNSQPQDSQKLSNPQKQVILDEMQTQLVQFKEVSSLLERDRRMDQLMERVYFKFNDSQIPPAIRKDLIHSASFLLKELEQRGDMVLQIAGHADERGSEEYNLALGGRRAQSVYNFLRVYSSDPNLLLPISFGEEFPAVPASNEQAWNLNRRVEFNLLPKE